ncbi:MAG: hypothetical protein C0617_02680 [Desulfuromonas sp.]|uniref:GNAT family N-acetyltransferase n=1 Tax=Desulfuromonas sp. TaxID=892 RepID=UPI000CC59ADC|nr:GNAT family N-acetyltransferase [Desulfuromonas sp.]PLX86060.1 MAG: hypothetical protein C0617_02680 [Desulfuromonas sp.]
MSDVSETLLSPVPEAKLADWLRGRGRKIVCHRGRYWETSGIQGYYRPIHWMARMVASEATRPTPFAWGFWTTLAVSDAGFANGALPVHVLDNYKQYDLQSLSSKRRNKVRNCLKKVKFIQISDPDLLYEQGYEVLISNVQRTGFGKVPTYVDYKKDVEQYFIHHPGVLIGGLIDGKLAGYAFAYAIGSTAYIDSLYLTTESLSSNIGTAMVFELIQMFRRSNEIKEVINSPHIIENASLSKFKKEMGFSVLHVPTRRWFAPPLEKILIEGYMRKKRPHGYYRLCGHY